MSATQNRDVPSGDNPDSFVLAEPPPTSARRDDARALESSRYALTTVRYAVLLKAVVSIVNVIGQAASKILGRLG